MAKSEVIGDDDEGSDVRDVHFGFPQGLWKENQSEVDYIIIVIVIVS